MASTMTAERRIVLGSRPTVAQWPSRILPLAASVFGPPHTFQWSACRAAIFSVTFSPPPPTISSGWGFCTGLGSCGASSSA